MNNRPTKDKPRITYVKKARQWCKTYFEGDKQIQEWSDNDPTVTQLDKPKEGKEL